MATATARKPNSRETRAPKLTKTGKKKGAVPTERDKDVWRRVLLPYPVARLDVIHAFMGEDGGNYDALSRHYDALSREPNCYVHRPTKQWQDRRAYGRATVYGLDRNGFDAIAAPYHELPHLLEHELMWCEFIQNVQLGARSHGLPFADRDAVLTSPNLPEATRTALRENKLFKPFEFSVVRHGDQGTAAADGWPFGIPVTHEDQDIWRFFFVQADCDNEPLISTDKKRTSVERHILDAIYIITNKLHDKQLGLPPDECYFIFITPSLTRLQNMKDIVERLTVKNRWLREYFLFKDFPTFMSLQRPTTLTGDIFTALYDRVEFPPFSFLKL